MIESIKKQYASCEQVEFVKQNELLLIRVNNTLGSAEIAFQGAQINRYQAIDGPTTLFTSDANTYSTGSPLRGGVPICWPWFGDLDKNPQEIQQQLSLNDRTNAPAHGFVRSQEWELNSIESSDILTRIEFKYINSKHEPLWPFATELKYRIEVSDSLNLSLKVINNDSREFTYSQALHSYFAVKDIHKTAIRGFNESIYADALDKNERGEWLEKSQHGDISFNQEVDRVYHSAPSPIELLDNSLSDSKSKTLKIFSSGTASTVIWNPWIDKSKTLSQFNDDDYKNMVCIESANTLDNSVTLKPNESHELTINLAY